MKTIELTIDEDGEVEVCRRRPQPSAPQQGFATRNSCQLTAKRSRITQRRSCSRPAETHFEKRYRSRKGILKFGDKKNAAISS